MARIAAIGWLYVIAPIHGGMAVTLVHPTLDRKEFFPLAVITALVWFAAIVAGINIDSKNRSWSWAGRSILAGYILPLLFLAAVQVALLAHEAGEFGRLWEDVHPGKKISQTGFLKNTPPKTPTPAFKRLTGILATWVWASIWFLAVLCNATPTWLWLSALVWGLVRYEQ